MVLLKRYPTSPGLDQFGTSSTPCGTQSRSCPVHIDSFACLLCSQPPMIHLEAKQAFLYSRYMLRRTSDVPCHQSRAEFGASTDRLLYTLYFSLSV